MKYELNFGIAAVVPIKIGTPSQLNEIIITHV